MKFTTCIACEGKGGEQKASENNGVWLPCEFCGGKGTIPFQEGLKFWSKFWVGHYFPWIANIIFDIKYKRTTRRKDET